MRLIDADRLRKEIERLKAAAEGWSREYACGITAGLSMAQLRVGEAPTIAPPPNEPLTVDELREMDGEPIWWEDKYGRSGWGLVSVSADCIMINVVNDEPFCAVSHGILNTPFVVGLYHRKSNAWVKVTDGPPEEGQHVIVTLLSEATGKRWVDTNYTIFSKGIFMWWDDDEHEWTAETDKVTHWMPYPTPAKD